jgi:molybdate transport system substrate-binding protein
VAAAGDAVEGIAFDESGSAVNTYPIVAVADPGTDGDTSAIVDAFIQYVTSAAGRAVLVEAGFGVPE